jgi:hypothetical protein
VSRETGQPSRSDGDDPLDQLLQQARWPAPRKAAEERLYGHWREISAAARRRQMFWRRASRLALAACLLGAVAGGWFALRQGGAVVVRPDQPRVLHERTDRRSPVIAETPKAVHTARRPTIPSGLHDAAVKSDQMASGAPFDGSPDVAYSRPPNELEQILFGGLFRRREASARKGEAVAKPSNPSATAVVAAGRNSLRDREGRMLQTALEKLIADPKLDAAKVAAPLQQLAGSYEVLLLAVLNGPGRDKQIAALRLLAELGSPLAVPDVLEAATDANLHSAAIATLCRLADASTLAELANRESDAPLQRSLFETLLSRGDASSVSAYLKFVDNAQTSAAALEAAEAVKNPPLDLLFAMLEVPLESKRIAAARVIGRIDGPEATARLIAMVETGAGRQEACVALLSSRGEEAVRYVAGARSNPILASAFNSSLFLLPSDSQPRS